jgi:transcriptional regulator with XRE-family HTH domain
MRTSPLRHNLARLRTFLNLGQKELADLADCSTRAIQSIELGTLRLSERLARRIAAATGVHVGWLLDNHLKEPIRPAGFERMRPYTRSDYERAQAAKTIVADGRTRNFSADYAASFYGQIRAILSSAAKKGLAEVATWRIAKFLDDCRREFGHDKQLIKTEEQFGPRGDESPYLKLRQVQAGIALFRKYDRDRERSSRQRLARLVKRSGLISVHRRRGRRFRRALDRAIIKRTRRRTRRNPRMWQRDGNALSAT